MNITKLQLCAVASILSGFVRAANPVFSALTDEITSDEAWGTTAKPTASDRVQFTTTNRSFTFADNFMMGGISIEVANATNKFTVADGKTVEMPMGLYHNTSQNETTITNGIWDFKSATYGWFWTQFDDKQSRLTSDNVIKVDHAVITNVTVVKHGMYGRNNRIVFDKGSRVSAKEIVPANENSKSCGVEIRGGSVFRLSGTANGVWGSAGSTDGYVLVSGQGSVFTNAGSRQIFCRKSTGFVLRAEDGGVMSLGDGIWYGNQTPSASNRIEAANGRVEFRGDFAYPQDGVVGPHDYWIDASDNGTFYVSGATKMCSSNNYVRARSGGTVHFKGNVTFTTKDNVFIMSNGTIRVDGSYFIFADSAACTNNTFVFQGTNPVLKAGTHCYPRKGMRLRFEIPKEGYADGARLSCYDFPETPLVYFDFVGLDRFQHSFRGVKKMTLIETTHTCIGNLKSSVDLANQQLAAAGYKDISLSTVGYTKVVLTVRGKPGFAVIVR